MDSTLNTLIDTTLSNFITLFWNLQPSLIKEDATQFKIDWGVRLGWVGACLAFFLSIAGVFTAGSSVIQELDVSYFSFLEDFQDNDDYIALMDDEVKNQQMSDFLTVNALDTWVMMAAIFAHCTFLLSAGFGEALVIFYQISAFTTAYNGGDIPIDKAWKLLLFGVLVGSLDYVAGWAVTIRKVTLLEMTGFHAHTAVKTTTETKTSTTALNGTVTTATANVKTYERKKDIFSLNEILENWPILFWSQRFLQLSLPYMYLFLIDAFVVMAVSLTAFWETST